MPAVSNSWGFASQNPKLKKWQDAIGFRPTGGRLFLIPGVFAKQKPQAQK
jgi:hypothetical protein